MDAQFILTVITTLVTSLGLQKAGPMIVSAWARRLERKRTETFEREKTAASREVERERIDSAQLIEREKTVTAREQEFHRIEAALRAELSADREKWKKEAAEVNVKLAKVASHYRRCERDRKRLHRRVKSLEERLATSPITK